MKTYTKNYIRQFKYYKSLADKAIKQITPEQLYLLPEPASNSVAIIMKHIAGNMLSRWTEIFITDGEKEWRHRDVEFDTSDLDHTQLMDYWEKAWTTLFTTLDGLSDSDLEQVIYIRNIGHTVQEAIIRQICHYPYHVGQIVFICKMWKGEAFVSLSIPKGQSGTYNKEKFRKEKTKKHFTDDL